MAQPSSPAGGGQGVYIFFLPGDILKQRNQPMLSTLFRGSALQLS